MGRVEGKVAIVTGGASGLGAADARALAAEGAAVIVTDLDVAKGEALAAEIGAEFFEQDVSDEPSWVRLIEQTVARHGGLDILVNNAGIAIIADIAGTTTEIWRRTLAVHLDGAFFGCHHALPAMAASGGGSLINMSSTAALVGIGPYLAYSAAKGGIRSMTKSIAAYCRTQRNGVRCNSVHPGSIDTPMVHAALGGFGGPRPEGERFSDEVRRKLGLGEPADVGQLVLFLASDESKHISGAEMVIDNGDTVVQLSGPGGSG
ncbi:MAG: SDR family oxidoreductase [Myxococcota bacterium]|nr:SDR family oxidoreductase [Myxococcota bacterium]